MVHHVHLRISVWTLMLLGWWPVTFEHKCFNVLYKLYGVATISIHIVFVVSQYVEMYLLIGKSYDDIPNLMGVNLLVTLDLVKVWVVRSRIVQKLVSKISATENAILESKDRDTKIVYAKYVSENYRANQAWIVLGYTSLVLFNSAPKVTELLNPNLELYRTVNGTITYLPRPLVFNAWVPFDRYKYYSITMAWQVLSAVVLTTYLTACNTFLYGLTTFALGQIKLVQKQFQEAVSDTEMIKCSIIYHRAVILFVEELSDAMKVFLLFDYAACALQIAVIGFQAAVMDLSYQLLKMVIYLMTMLLQLFLFYWYGNELLLESMEIANAVWESKWYVQKQSTKKTLMIIMIRAQKPLKLRVGPFYYVSLQTMMTILRIGYSYAAVMRRLYSGK